jgi:hypothetical protein
MLNDVVSTKHCIKLEDSLAEAFCIVNHAYGGHEFVIDTDNLLDCSRMAKKYDMPRLQRILDAFVEQIKLADDNLPDWMAVAHGDPELPELQQRCVEFAAKHLQSVLNFR